MTDTPAPKPKRTPAEREVRRLLRKAEQAADQAEPKDAARTCLGIASLISRNAGLDKRHATKVDLGGGSVDEWVASLAKPKADP